MDKLAGSNSDSTAFLSGNSSTYHQFWFNCRLLPKIRDCLSCVLVFAKADKAIAAEEAGADYVGGEDYAKKIQEGWLEFDRVVATPDMMAVVGRIGKILGPRGLMPNPKVGTVTFEVESAIKNIKAGQIEFRADKQGNLHAAVGKISFDADKLCENVTALVDTVKRMKPSASKGIYLRNFSLSSTMGPGLKVDPQTI